MVLGVDTVGEGRPGSCHSEVFGSEESGASTCRCPDGTVLLGLDGAVASNTTWEMSSMLGFACKSQCLRNVYEGLFSTEFDMDAVRFPQPLVEKADVECMLKHAATLSLLRVLQNNDRSALGAGAVEFVRWRSSDGKEVVFKEVMLTDAKEVWVIGDLHGRFGSFRRIHKRWVENHRLPYLVFLGDLVDRGNRQVEVALGALAMRAMYPHRVTIVKGNHEETRINSHSGLRCASGGAGCVYPGLDLYTKLNDKFFRRLPVMVRIRHLNKGGTNANALFMHGGWGRNVDRFVMANDFDSDNMPKPTKVNREFQEEIEWSEDHIQGWAAVRRYQVQLEEYEDKRRELAAGSPSEPRAEESEPGPHGRTDAQYARLIQGLRRKIESMKRDIDTSFMQSARGAGEYRPLSSTQQVLARLSTCILVTGHAHTTEAYEVPGISGCAVNQKPDSGGALVLLSAHDMDRHHGMLEEMSNGSSGSVVSPSRCTPRKLSGDKGPGYFGVITVGRDGVPVSLEKRRIFVDDQDYDLVSEILDVGLDSEYPMYDEGSHGVAHCGYVDIDTWSQQGKACVANGEALLSIEHI